MNIKVNHSVIPNPELVKSYFDSILSSGVLTNNGPFVKRFEAEIQNWTQNQHCHLTTSGTRALELGIRALGLTGEIITTPFSFIASASSILWENCTPVFVDINPNTLCIDEDKIEQFINSRTSGILAVHTFGNPCDIDAICSLAQKYNLKTIFDGAHAFGVNYQEKSIFSYGDITTTSFHAFKIVNAGEGGAIFTSDKKLSKKIFEMRYFGNNKNNFPVGIGTNAKMSEFNAALGLVSLNYLNSEIEKRKIIAQDYLHALGNFSTIDIPDFIRKCKTNFSYFPIILQSEKEVLKLLSAAEREGIFLKRYFYPSLNQLSFMKTPSKTPIANRLSKRIVCLPIYSTLTHTDIKRITQIIRQAE